MNSNHIHQVPFKQPPNWFLRASLSPQRAWLLVQLDYVSVGYVKLLNQHEERNASHKDSERLVFHLSKTWIVLRCRLSAVLIRKRIRTREMLSTATNFTLHCAACVSGIYLVWITCRVRSLRVKCINKRMWPSVWATLEKRVTNAAVVFNVPITKMTFDFLVSAGKPGGILEEWLWH